MSTRRSLLLVALLSIPLAITAQDAGAQATIQVNNNDGPGEGFNDPTPVAPVGGNPGTTLGAQRLNAFQYAVDVVAAAINSGVVIEVDAQMNPLTCTPTAAVLGSAGTNSVHGNFTNAPVLDTWYPQALANALAGVDLNPGVADIGAQFNSSINGDPGCLAGYSWYYGYDQADPPSTIDFVTVVLHEICHGLGFQTFVSESGGKLGGFDDVYMLQLEHHFASPPDYPSMSNAQRAAANIADPNLHWSGFNVNLDQLLIVGVSNGHVRMHGPNPYQPGSSVSHFSTALLPDELMEPSYTGPDHTPGLALSLFEDIGWTLVEEPPVSVAITGFEARAVDRGVEIRASFASDGDGDVAVNVYRARGDSEDFVRLETVASDGTAEFVYLDAAVEPGRTYTYRIGVSDRDGEFFSPADRVTLPAAAMVLDQNVPNPFNPTTVIRFSLSSPAPVKLMVYDARGQLVRTLVDENRGVGPHDVVWDGRDAGGDAVSSGIYFYRIEAGSFIQSRKMVLLK